MSLLLLFPQVENGPEPPEPAPQASATQYPLRLSLYWEELEYRRDLFADALGGEGLTHALFGGGGLSITLPRSHALADPDAWVRTIVVAHHPHLPPLPLAPTTISHSFGQSVKIVMKDAGVHAEWRLVQVPNLVSISSNELLSIIHEDLLRPPASPIRKVRWEADDKILDLRGTFRVEGRTLAEILNWLATEHAMIWYVEWNEEAEQCELVIRPMEGTEPRAYISTPQLLDTPEIAIKLDEVRNRAVCGSFIGKVVGNEFVFTEDEESIARYGQREVAFTPHGQNPTYTELIARLKRPATELPIAVPTECFRNGLYLGDSVVVELPGQNYELSIEAIGVANDLRSAVIKPHAVEEL